MAKWLKPLVPKQDNRQFYGYDIETADEGITFVSASLYYSDERQWFFTDKQSVIEFFTHRSFKNTIIVATNSSYDWGGTFSGTPEEMEFKLIMRGTRLLSAKTHITPKGLKRNHDDSTHTCLLEFWDTLNFAVESVEGIGKLLGFPKLEHPASFGRKPLNQQEWDELQAYNMRDAEISKKFLNFMRSYLEKMDCPLKMTIAGCAMAYFRTNHLHDNYIQPEEHVLLEQFESYYGGRTEVIKRGEHFNLNYYDINSLYPSVMADNVFPNPNTMQSSTKNSTDKIEQYEGYSLVTIHCPDLFLPLLPFRAHDGKLIFPKGTFTGRYTHVELRKAMQLGYTIQHVHASTYYKETIRPFTFMRTLYHNRKKFKQEGNDFMAYVVKLIMNSMYGKFGQRFTNVDVFEPFNLTFEELEALEGKFDRVGNYYKTSQNVPPSSFCVPIWASYVTAYARLRIHELAMKHDACYMDTDSIFTKDTIPVTDDLGGLKLEMPLARALFVRPKFYVLDNGSSVYFKIKGISMKLVVTFAGTSTNTRTYQDMKELIKNPVISFKRFRRLREAQRKKLPLNEVFTTCKQLTIQDEKREWKKEFPSRGHEVSQPLFIVSHGKTASK